MSGWGTWNLASFAPASRLSLEAMRKTSAVLGVLLSLVVGEAGGDIYVYVDDDGVTHITNQPDGNRPWQRYLETSDPEVRRPREGVVPVAARDTSPDRYSRYDAYILEASLLYQVPEALIRARIAAGLSQQELARRLGLKAQQIQRYEATRYAGVTLERVQAVVDALGVQLHERVVLPRAAGPTAAGASAP